MAKTVDEVKAEIREDIDELIDLFSDLEEDGWQIPEIVRFTFQAGIRLIDAVDDFQDITGPEKKEVVVSTVKEIYQEISPDIPVIPEPFETWVENFMLDRVLPGFIDAQVRRMREKEGS